MQRTTVFMRRAVLALVFLASARPLVAQDVHPADTLDRLKRFGQNVAFGTALGLAWAGVAQWQNDPPEWGSGSSGYGKRAASGVGEFLIQESVTDLLAAGMHRPLDYQRCTCHKAGGRIGWAISTAVTDPMAGNKRMLAVPRIVGAYAGSFAQAAWRPKTGTGSNMNSALLNGSISLLIGAGINLWYEFRPAGWHL